MVALGCDLLHRPLFEGVEGLLLPPARFLCGHDWVHLVREGVVDAALVPELELESPSPGVRVLALGALPLALLARVGGWEGPVLAPPQEQAPGWVGLLQRAGLRLQRAPRQAQHNWRPCSCRFRRNWRIRASRRASGWAWDKAWPFCLRSQRQQREPAAAGGQLLDDDPALPCRHRSSGIGARQGHAGEARSMHFVRHGVFVCHDRAHAIGPWHWRSQERLPLP
jgi:hypothetical protein